MTLYRDMLNAGLFEGNRYSDLYVRDTPKAREILSMHGKKVDGWNVVSFYDQSTDSRQRLLEIPFAYDP